MERIKIFVQKIQEIYYSKHTKSAIDIDLMLDYTRVMYMDLLDWRKGFAEVVHSDMATIMQENSKIINEEITDTPEITATPATHSDDVQINETMQEQASEETNLLSTSDANKEQETPSATEPEIENKPEQEEEETLIQNDFPEEENIITLAKEHTGISFEAPSPAEKIVDIEDTLVEEAPVVTNTTFETPAPTPDTIPFPETKIYEPAKLFDNITETKDIRTSIGINDKYLFLNELFNNHKSDYEETLDKLNRTASLSEAKNWMKTKVAAASHWDDNDATVQSFYSLLEKHFSAR